MEIAATQFYEHRSFINVYYYAYVALENWITQNIFREDPTRVFLASNDYAFRRRFELTDASRDFENSTASSLNFPFANYWPLNTGWKPDDRIAATTAAMIYRGIYEGNTRYAAIPSIMPTPVTFYFDREDDARMAYDILYFKSFNEHYYIQKMPYAGNTLEIPIYIKIDNIEFNPQNTEETWLKENRIFPVTAVFNLRTFVIKPPKQPPYSKNKWDSDYDDGYEKYYLTEEVLLKFTPGYHSIYPDVLTVTGSINESDLDVKLSSTLLNNNHSVKLSWVIKNTEKTSKISNIKIYAQNGAKLADLDGNKKSYTIQDLQINSDYIFQIIFYTEDGKSKKLIIPIYSEQKKEKEKEEISKNSLVGISW